MNESQDNIAAIEHRLTWLTRLLGAGVLALVVVTWKLWTPQEVFPRVPLFRWAPPDWWDWASLALILAGGVGLLIRPPRYVRPLAATLAFGLAIAFVCDQHRLQPWAWQFFILALLIALADDALLWNGWQWLTISIYFYSALSKFDADFTETMGYLFLRALSGFRPTAGSWSDSHLEAVARYSYLSLLFPAFEMLVVFLLTRPSWRRYGLIAAIFMHITLIWLLGFGLRHSWGVLLWNVFFICQAVILFGPNVIEHALRGTSSSCRMTNRIAHSLLAFFLALPALVPWGLCDLWPGWAVYVRPFEQAYITVSNAALREAPHTRSHPYWRLYRPGQSFLADQLPIPILISDLSLESVSAPPYPNVRCSLAVALDVAENLEQSDIEVAIARRSRWDPSGLSVATKLTTEKQIHDYSKRFWFNAYPTSMYRRAAKERAMKDDG